MAFDLQRSQPEPWRMDTSQQQERRVQLDIRRYDGQGNSAAEQLPKEVVESPSREKHRLSMHQAEDALGGSPPTSWGRLDDLVVPLPTLIKTGLLLLLLHTEVLAASPGSRTKKCTTSTICHKKNWAAFENQNSRVKLSWSSSSSSPEQQIALQGARGALGRFPNQRTNRGEPASRRCCPSSGVAKAGPEGY